MVYKSKLSNKMQVFVLYSYYVTVNKNMQYRSRKKVNIYKKTDYSRPHTTYTEESMP